MNEEFHNHILAEMAFDCQHCGTPCMALSPYTACPRCHAGYYNKEPMDPPFSWQLPTPSEMEYARATMPGKATGHIEGWRIWLATEQGILGSLNTNTRWEPRQPMIASVSPHAPPAYGPGIYAVKTCEELRYLPPNIKVVVGKVALWGYVAEHDEGYRARYAYPLELYMTEGWEERHWAPLYDKINFNYRVPVKPHHFLRRKHEG